jgi:hypothetical protein
MNAYQLVEIELAEETEILGGNPSHCHFSPQIFLPWDRTRADALGNWRLTA